MMMGHALRDRNQDTQGNGNEKGFNGTGWDVLFSAPSDIPYYLNYCRWLLAPCLLRIHTHIPLNNDLTAEKNPILLCPPFQISTLGLSWY